MNILLGVCGSISCYKAFDLLRLFVKDGHDVRVILTKGAENFLKPELFRYLGAQKVYTYLDDFNKDHYEDDDAGNVLHIDLIHWADKFVIAPASANSIARLSMGPYEDLLSTSFLAWPPEKEILIFPAMNTKMLQHPFTQDHVKKLSALPNLFFAPTEEGELACGDQGAGRLLSIDIIFHLTTCFSLKKLSTPAKALISTGATIAPLDPVRFLTNASSGITGFYLAKEALNLGYDVVVIAGQSAVRELDYLVSHPRYTLIRVTTSEDMHQAVHEHFSSCDHYISSAAIGDIEFEQNSSKLKKSSLTAALPVKKATDILAKMIEQKKQQNIVGFAAETSLSDQMLTEKLTRKPVSLLVATQVHHGLTQEQKAQGFAQDGATYRFCTSPNDLGAPITMSKKDLAHKIFHHLDSL